MNPNLSRTEKADEEFEVYLWSAARKIANEGHCTACSASTALCKAKIAHMTSRIHALCSEAILYHSGMEELPTIDA